MKNLIFILALLAVTGCSGEAFTGVDFTRMGGDAQESDSGALGTGGASGVDEDGGTVAVGTGGRPQEKDGGGARSSGGSTVVGTGGAPGTGGTLVATGGTTGTGGVTDTGGTIATGGAGTGGSTGGTTAALCCKYTTGAPGSVISCADGAWVCDSSGATSKCAQCATGMVCHPSGVPQYWGVVEVCP